MRVANTFVTLIFLLLAATACAKKAALIAPNDLNREASAPAENTTTQKSPGFLLD